MHAILVSFLIATTAIATPAPVAKKAKTPTDHERLQGEWVIVEMETPDGVDTFSPYEKERGTTVWFEKDGFRMVERGETVKEWSDVTFTLSRTLKTRMIDFEITDGKEQRTVTGIYSFEEDTLVVYIAPTRPKNITDKPTKDTGGVIFRLKRPML